MAGTGRTLANRYELLEPLGRGGMAAVYRARDRVLDRIVAVKVLAPALAADQRFVSRFRREAKAAAQLNHPNVVGVYDSGSDANAHFIVMEHVEGRTLREVLDGGGPLPADRAVEIATDACRGLAAAHARGLVHRDVKPENVMLTPEGRAKVMDFGIARSAVDATLTQTGSVLGSPSYVSPEQARGEKVDARSDVYSLGCVLYEMLTGSPPFEADTPVGLVYKHVNEEAPSARERQPGVPPALEAVIASTMAKEPGGRPQSAEALATQLEAARAEAALAVSAGATVPLAAPVGGTEPLPVFERRSRWPLWTGALLAVVLLAVGLALGRGAPDPRPVGSPATSEDTSPPPTTSVPPTPSPTEDTGGVTLERRDTVEGAVDQLFGLLAAGVAIGRIPQESAETIRTLTTEAVQRFDEDERGEALALLEDAHEAVASDTEGWAENLHMAIDFVREAMEQQPPPEDDDEGNGNGNGNGKDKGKGKDKGNGKGNGR